jgi:hypothetical protein
MSEGEIAEIEARAGQPGGVHDWIEKIEEGYEDDGPYVECRWCGGILDTPVDIDEFDEKCDKAPAAHTDVPRLIATIRTLQARLKAVEGERDAVKKAIKRARQIVADRLEEMEEGAEQRDECAYCNRPAPDDDGPITHTPECFYAKQVNLLAILDSGYERHITPQE